MAANRTDDEVDYAKSTGAYPMDSEPKVVFVDSDVDYAKSTGAYPMYDDPKVAAEASAGGGVTTTTDGTTVESTGAFPTPGPASLGYPDAVATQRTDLGLTADASGDSDSGYEARPSTIPAAAEAPADDAEETPVADQKPAPPSTKTVKTAQTKVVKPPAPPTGQTQTTATTK